MLVESGSVASGRGEAGLGLPRMEALERLWRLPMMSLAWNTSATVYGRVKGSSGLVHGALSGAEGAMQCMVGHVGPVAATFLESPIQAVDAKLCRGLQALEQSVPMVKEPPQQMLATAKRYVSDKLQPARANLNVASLKQLSWSKANEVLSSRYGHAALQRLDSTSSVAEHYIDYYLPPTEGTADDLNVHSSNECDDKVLHTMHTVGVLSTKLGRRVYAALCQRMRDINYQNINAYLSSLSAIVSLTAYLNAINQRVEERRPEPLSPTLITLSSAQHRPS